VKFTRITVDPLQMGGVPCIRGLRIPAATVVGMFADGMTQVEILKTYPDLESADVREAMRYAAEALEELESIRACDAAVAVRDSAVSFDKAVEELNRF
jgi:uncharacterized protein (DUF433 family)